MYSKQQVNKKVSFTLFLAFFFTLVVSTSVFGIDYELKRGDQDEEMIPIKQQLNWLNYDGIRVNETFGSWTETRVKHFQSDYGLDDTGIIESTTYNKLNEVFNNVFIDKNQKHSGVVKMKEALTDVGFGGMNINQTYGSYTTQRVESFQNYYGLEVNGRGTLESLNYLQDLIDSPFQEGGEHADVIPMKQKLNQLGYDGIRVNERYGSWTATRVSQFQRDHGLVNNGIADQPTLNKLNEVYDSALKQGDSSEELIPIKQKLNWLGYDGIRVNERFGSWTATRVSQFQDDYNVPGDGIINDPTKEKLEEVFYNVFRYGGTNHPGVVKMKEALTDVGFGGMNINQTYGSYTTQRVESFQNYYGLEVNGRGTLESLNYLQDLIDSPFQEGGEHADVIPMKQKLNQLGYDGIRVNERYGSWTATRVSQFQRDHGLVNNGIADQPTLNKLNEVYDSALKQGDSSEELIPIKQKLNWLGYDGIRVNERFGSWTATRVSQFQDDYNVPGDGIINDPTKEKLEEVFYNVFRYGGTNHPGVVKMKEALTDVGFGGMNINQTYGSYTTQRVESFQNYYGLEVNGRGTLESLNYLQDLIDSPLQNGGQHPDVVPIKEKLNRLGFDGIRVNERFGSWTSTRVSQFQSHFGLVQNGIADSRTLNKLDEILDSPYQLGRQDPYTVEIKEMLINLGYGGMNVNENFGSWTETRVKQFQEDYGLPVSGIVDEVTLQKLMDATDVVVKTTNYNINFNRAVDIQMSQGSPKYDGAGQIPADKPNVKYYLNPSNFSEGSPQFLQFLILDESTNLSATTLNENFLNNSGTLTGEGQAFIDAGKAYGLNELYLIAHALHETSHGTSTLAKGVGVDGNGNVVRDSNGNIIRDINHKDVDHIVYNMYGYGAHDDNPTNGGAKYAFDNGWFSPGEAVIGGAERIANSYIARGQNTLYKMKWDPEYLANNNSLGRQYATHIMWAEIQAKMLHNMLGSSINDFPLRYDIPEYLNQPGSDGSKPPPPTQNDNDYPSGIIGTVATSSTGLNLREGPGTNYDVIKSIPKDSEVEILDDNESGWLNIRHNGDQGWVSEDFIDIKNLYKVNGDGVNYRTSPAGEVAGYLSNELVGLSLDSNYNIVSEEAELGGTNYTWYRITINGQNYWMASSFLEEVN